MSDPREPMGEPVEEPTPVADVVSQAHEGLAEAEAARRDAPDEPRPTRDGADEPRPSAEPVQDAEGVRHDAQTPDRDAAPGTTATGTPDAAGPSAGDAHVFATPALNDAHGADDANDANGPYVDAETPETSAPAEAAYVAPVAEPAYTAPQPPQPQPIFVQAPEEPRPRGNRAAAGAIGLVAAVCFAVLYLAAGAVIGLVDGKVTIDSIGTWLGGEVTTWGLWVPTVVFFLAFWLLGAIINRGRWGAWVILGVLVGLAAYGGHILGQLFEAPFWMVSADEGGKIVVDQLFAPLAVAAFVIGRELTVWFSAWAAARGRRMTELNIEARREYERTLEAGPRLADR